MAQEEQIYRGGQQTVFSTLGGYSLQKLNMELTQL